MGTVGIVPEIFSPVVRIGVIRDTLRDPKLQIPFEEIKIIMRIQSKMLTKGWIVHILINKRKTGIGISQIGFPVFVTESFSVETDNNTTRVIGNQMGNVRIVQKYRTIKLADIQGILLGNITILGKSKANTQQNNQV